MSSVRAARRALKAHDSLLEVGAREPGLDFEGMPLDEGAWRFWRRTQSEPAFVEWSHAMDELAASLGDPGMSRHPANFRPLCEQIIAEAS